MNRWYIVEVVTHLAKSLVERLSILKKNACCPCYEIDKINVERRIFLGVPVSYVQIYVETQDWRGKTRCTIASLRRIGVLGVLPPESAES